MVLDVFRDIISHPNFVKAKSSIINVRLKELADRLDNDIDYFT